MTSPEYHVVRWENGRVVDVATTITARKLYRGSTWVCDLEGIGDDRDQDKLLADLNRGAGLAQRMHEVLNPLIDEAQKELGLNGSQRVILRDVIVGKFQPVIK